MKNLHFTKYIKIILICALFCTTYTIHIGINLTNFLNPGIVYAQDTAILKKAEYKSTSANIKNKNGEKELNLTTKTDSVFVEEIKQKELELQKREQEIKREEENLKILKADVEQKIAELKKLKAELDETIKKVDAQHLKNLKRLVTSFEAMKPEEAAKVVEGLSINDAASIILMMSEKKAGKILGVVSPDIAIKITEQINKTKK